MSKPRGDHYFQATLEKLIDNIRKHFHAVLDSDED